MNQAQQIKCDRCGFVADDRRKLIAHLRNEASCPPLLSTLAHQDIIDQHMATLERTCYTCWQVFSTKAGKTRHAKVCNIKQIQRTSQNSNRQTSHEHSNGQTSQEHSNGQTSLLPIKVKKSNQKGNKKVKKVNNLFPFDGEITTTNCGIDKQKILEYASREDEGIVQFFIDLHSMDNHKNIKWIEGKLVVYVDNKWIFADQHLLCSHIGMLYSIIEETWCDYEMDLRCGNRQSIFDTNVVERTNKFLYEVIVDDTSVLFQCEDKLIAYLEGLK